MVNQKSTLPACNFREEFINRYIYFPYLEKVSTVVSSKLVFVSRSVDITR